MFQRITVRRMNPTATENFVDIGFLCEAMLFYREVVVIADPAIMKQLVNQIGGDTLVALLENDFLRLHYVSEHHAIESIQPTTPSTVYSALRVSSPAQRPATFFPKLLTEKIGKRRKAERLSEKILRHTIAIQNDPAAANSFLDAVRNRAVLENLVAAYLQRYLRMVGLCLLHLSKYVSAR